MAIVIGTEQARVESEWSSTSIRLAAGKTEPAPGFFNMRIKGLDCLAEWVRVAFVLDVGTE